MNDTGLRVGDIIAEYLGVPLEAIPVESRFIDDLGCDSLDHTELVTLIEAEFDINIAEDIVVLTVGDVIKAVEDALAKRAA